MEQLNATSKWYFELFNNNNLIEYYKIMLFEFKFANISNELHSLFFYVFFLLQYKCKISLICQDYTKNLKIIRAGK